MLAFAHLRKTFDTFKEKTPMNHEFQQENWMWSQCVDRWQEPRLIQSDSITKDLNSVLSGHHVSSLFI